MSNQGEAVDRLDELAGPHEQWCHGDAHKGCCCLDPDDDCDCGRNERRELIAAALAEERRKARMTFRAIADTYSDEALDEHHAGFTTAMDLVTDIRDAAGGTA